MVPPFRDIREIAKKKKYVELVLCSTSSSNCTNVVPTLHLLQLYACTVRYVRTGLLEWAHTFLLLRDPVDLKFSSLIQRVFLMRLEHSDLINNLYLFI